jgi:phytoene dehydrogenase-like protein
MPPELVDKLGIDLPILRRDPHYFLPTQDAGYLLFGSDQEATRRQFLDFFSEADWRAHVRLQDELDKLREDIAPTWLEAPVSIEETANRWVRPELQETFVNLCRRPVGEYLRRFDFQSELVEAMYAVTDGFTGSFSSWDEGASGMNFLIHNMCRLPNSHGVWSIVKGGMGTVSARLADAAREAGARRLILDDGREVCAEAIVVNADPFRMRKLVGRERLPSDYNDRLDDWLCDGTTLKVNLALEELPQFRCLPEDRGQYGATMHILPEGDSVLAEIDPAYHAVKRGELPESPTIEWYVHTVVDPSLSDPDGHHSSALFVQWVPYDLRDSTWEDEATGYAEHLLSICDRFAPGTSDRVADMFVLHPQKIEEHFGITRGHIHHIDNVFGFDDRHPYKTPVDGLYSCSAGCHPGGSVIGASGHNAAMQVLEEMEVVQNENFTVNQ